MSSPIIERFNHSVPGTTRWSNCLLEAIRAKMKDPSNVTISYIPSDGTRDGIPIAHFIWSDGQYEYDFCSFNRKPKYLINHIIFKGSIRRHRLGWANWMTRRSIKRKYGITNPPTTQ